MKFGIDRLLEDRTLQQRLRGRRIGLLAHPASVTIDLVHSLDALSRAGLKLSAAFGPQHGLRATSRTTWSSRRTSPTRCTACRSSALRGSARPTAAMGPLRRAARRPADLGCRIYTFITRCSTCSRRQQSTARKCGCSTAQSPAGRSRARPARGLQSFVARAAAQRHGLTLASWHAGSSRRSSSTCNARWLMREGSLHRAGFGWPLGERAW